MQDYLFLNAINGKSVDRMPVWIMRQAGRYLPEYRAIRSKKSNFMSLCKNSDLAAEVTLQPIDRFGLDAAIIFSDILTIPDAMGLDLEFIDGQGPVFKKPISSTTQIDNLSFDVVSDLDYVFAAIVKAKQALAGRVPLIGFSGSPWTLAAYMIEGSGSKTFNKALSLVNIQSQAAHKLLSCLTANVIKYCSAQIEAGADAIMLFDSHGGKLANNQYDDFSLQYLANIIQVIKSVYPQVPIIVYGLLDTDRAIKLASIKPDVLGVSHLADLALVRKKVAANIVLQGNIDPGLLSQSDSGLVVDATKKCISGHAGFAGIINLGHGIKPDARIDQVKLMLKTAHDYSSVAVD